MQEFSAGLYSSVSPQNGSLQIKEWIKQIFVLFVKSKKLLKH